MNMDMAGLDVDVFRLISGHPKLTLGYKDIIVCKYCCTSLMNQMSLLYCEFKYLSSSGLSAEGLSGVKLQASGFKSRLRSRREVA